MRSGSVPGWPRARLPHQLRKKLRRGLSFPGPRLGQRGQRELRLQPSVGPDGDPNPIAELASTAGSMGSSPSGRSRYQWPYACWDCGIAAVAVPLTRALWASLVPFVVIEWRDLWPRPRHHLAVRPHADHEMEPDLHDQVREEHICAPAVARDRCERADHERRRVERGDHAPNPKVRWDRPTGHCSRLSLDENSGYPAPSADLRQRAR